MARRAIVVALMVALVLGWMPPNAAAQAASEQPTSVLPRLDLSDILRPSLLTKGTSMNPPRELIGVLLDEDRTAVGAQLVRLRRLGGSEVVWTTTRGDGTFRVDGLRLGIYGVQTNRLPEQYVQLRPDSGAPTLVVLRRRRMSAGAKIAIAAAVVGGVMALAFWRARYCNEQSC